MIESLLALPRVSNTTLLVSVEPVADVDVLYEDMHIPSMVKRAIRNAFVKADTQSLDNTSGTTALTALILG
ncbi:hypothetical protein H5410_001591, partial [Solanum commersonii]